jgi:hypothetical protein
MNSLHGMAAVLFVSAAAALIGAGCAATEEPGNTGIDSATEAGDTVGFVQEAQTHTEFGGGGGGGNECSWLENGAYCGGDQVSGNPSTLYRCYNGYKSVITHCNWGCKWEPPGVPDHCR